MACLGHPLLNSLSASSTDCPVAGNSSQERAGDDQCPRQLIVDAAS